MAVLIASIVLLYLVVGLLTILVVVLYRQFGLVYVGSRRSYELTGPPVGRPAPSGLTVTRPDNASLTLAIDWHATAPGDVTILILGGDACPLCDRLLDELDIVAAPAGLNRWKQLS
ncbi:MAG: hypothetical protein ACRDOK_23085 [Streptosporangiaceae bacterium]